MTYGVTLSVMVAESPSPVVHEIVTWKEAGADELPGKREQRSGAGVTVIWTMRWLPTVPSVGLAVAHSSLLEGSSSVMLACQSTATELCELSSFTTKGGNEPLAAQTWLKVVGVTATFTTGGALVGNGVGVGLRVGTGGGLRTVAVGTGVHVGRGIPTGGEGGLVTNGPTTGAETGPCEAYGILMLYSQRL